VLANLNQHLPLLHRLVTHYATGALGFCFVANR
jgi:hypothetical protein